MPRLLPVVALVVLFGCRPADEIRTYTVPTQPEPKPAPAPGTDTDRLLGALIPSADGRFYSVKLSGPIDAVSAQAGAFRSFVESVRVTADPAKPLTFTAPPGWKPQPVSPGGMRLATFDAGGLEAKVFVPFAGTLLENVLRWRKEVGAAPVTEADLPTAAPEIKLGDGKAFYVDARGSGGTGGMAGPFQKK